METTADMKKVYHFCLSAGDSGVLCRTEEDYRYLINCLGLAGYVTQSLLLAYCVMSNHVHCCLRTDDVVGFIKRWRYTYTRYFNERYKRKGRLGQDPYIVELNGLYHILTAIAYVLRNPMHHGVSATPFGYKYSSVNAIFRKEMGRDFIAHLPEKSMYAYLPHSVAIPDGYKMDVMGMFLPECLIDVEDVEHMFSTARSYLYYMNRLSGKKWEDEQLADGTAPITIDKIEQGSGLSDFKAMLNNEFGRADYNAMSDMRLCEIIDKDYILSFDVASVYMLDVCTRRKLAKQIVCKYYISLTQACRCLGISSSS